MENKEYIVKEDMICPMTNEYCDDECCPVGSECNLSPNENFGPPISEKSYIPLSTCEEKNKKLYSCLDQISVVAIKNGSITITEIRDICTPILKPDTNQKG